MKRREFLRRTSIAGAVWGSGVFTASGVLAACASTGRATTGSSGDVVGWARVPSILARIAKPTIPSREFDITRYGAVGDGIADASTAIKAAIAACVAAGGGRVVVPSGKFVTGPIHLQSHMALHVSKGATLAFVTEPARYLPAVLTRFEGVECFNYSPLIYAIDATDVAVTGEGTLDGQADNTNWWPWKGGAAYGWVKGAPNQLPARDRLIAMAEARTPLSERQFGTGGYLRPSFVQMYRCRNVLVESVTIVRSPMWEIHPVLSQNVIVRNVTVRTHGPNNDGCNPESCQDVLIEGCTFDTGDDCIAIKSGRNGDGRRVNVPTENVIVRNCRMQDGHGGVTIGSEISGSVRHVFVERCEMDSPNLERALRLKTNAMRGGTLEHIYMRDVRVGQVSDSILSVDFTYEEGAKGSFMPTVRDIEMRNVTSNKSKYGLYLRGFATAPITDIRLESCSFAGVENPDVLEHVSGLVRRDMRVNGQRVSS